MIYCETCENWCAHCLDVECCLCRLKQGKLMEACPDCRKRVLEYMKEYSRQITLDKFLVVS